MYSPVDKSSDSDSSECGDHSGWETVDSEEDDLEPASRAPLHPASSFEETMLACCVESKARRVRRMAYQPADLQDSKGSSGLDETPLASRAVEQRVQLFKFDHGDVKQVLKDLDVPVDDLNAVLSMISALVQPPGCAPDVPIVLEEETFSSVNHEAAFVLIHFLLGALDKDRMKMAFGGHEPPNTTKFSSAVLKKAVDLINHLRSESDLGTVILPHVSVKMLMEPGGSDPSSDKFKEFLLGFITFSLWMVLRKDLRTTGADQKGFGESSCKVWKHHVQAIANFERQNIPYLPEELPDVMRRFRCLMLAITSSASAVQQQVSRDAVEVQPLRDAYLKVIDHPEVAAVLQKIGGDAFEAVVEQELDEFRKVTKKVGGEFGNPKEALIVLRNGLNDLVPLVKEVLPTLEDRDDVERTWRGEENSADGSFDRIPSLAGRILHPTASERSTTGPSYGEHVNAILGLLNQRGDKIVQEALAVENISSTLTKGLETVADPLDEEIRMLEDSVVKSLRLVHQMMSKLDPVEASAFEEDEAVERLPWFPVWDAKCLHQLSH